MPPESHRPLDPHSENLETLPADYEAHHPDERPEDWGWHGETGKWGRIGGWIAVFVTLTFLIGNHEGRVEDLFVAGTALLMVIVLLWDRSRRKNAWRSRATTSAWLETRCAYSARRTARPHLATRPSPKSAT